MLTHIAAGIKTHTCASGNTTFLYSNISHKIMAPHLAAVAALMLEASDLWYDP